MRTGIVEASLVTLNEEFRLSFIPDLVARKTSGSERQTLDSTELAFFEDQYLWLSDELKQAGESTQLPESPRAKAELNNLLIRLRLG